MRVPEKLFQSPYHLRSLEMDGATVVESCTHAESTKNEMLVGEHLLLFVLEGRYIAKFGQDIHIIEKGEGLFIQRAHAVKYEKISLPEKGKPYESLMFFVSDKLIRDFLSFRKSNIVSKTPQSPISKIAFNVPIQIFLQSVLVSFQNGLSAIPHFLQNKLFELLFNLSEINPNLVYAFVQFTVYQPIDIHKVMEANYRQNLTLEEFAYKAGRSLASFKRDFRKAYNTTPHQWILSKRLDHAKHLIEKSAMKVSDACYEAGFESVAHFSRVFKEKFGISPSTLKLEPFRQTI